MARLPTIADMGDRPVPQPTTRVRSISGGDAVGQAMQGLGATVTDVGNVIGDREATIAAKERDTHVADELRRLLYDPENGFANLSGRAAVDAAGPLDEALEALTTEANSGLNNMASRKLESQLARRMEAARNTIAAHTSAELESLRAATTEARIFAAHQDALANPLVTADSIATITGEVTGRGGWAEQNNLDPANPDDKLRIDQELAARTSALYADQIRIAALTNPIEAVKLLNANADQMVQTDIFALQEMLQPAIEDFQAYEGAKEWEAAMLGGNSIQVQRQNAVASVETSGEADPYRALGDVITNRDSMYYGDRAYGRYQIMGKNIPEWSKAALGYEVSIEEFLASDSVQDQIFNHRFGLLEEEYGNDRDAASAWFTGGPLATHGNRHDGSETRRGINAREYVRRYDAAMATGNDGGHGDLSDATKEEIAQMIMDDQSVPLRLRRKTADEFLARANLTERRQEAERVDAVTTAGDLIWEQGLSPSDPDFPPEVRSALQNGGVWELAVDQYLQMSTGVQRESDPSWLQDNFYSLSPAEQLQVPAEVLLEHMNWDRWKAEMDARAQGRTMSPARPTTELIKDQMRSVGIDPSDRDDEDNLERINNFWFAYERARDRFVVENNRAPEWREEQDIIRDVTAATDLGIGSSYGFTTYTEIPAFELYEEDMISSLAEDQNVQPADIGHALAILDEYGLQRNRTNLEAILKLGEPPDPDQVVVPGPQVEYDPNRTISPHFDMN